MRLLALLSLLLLAGCVNQQVPESVPEDFHLIHSAGAMHAEWGGYGLEIDAQGNAEFTKHAQGKNASFSFNLTEEEMLELYTAIVQARFFDLKESYSDPSVIDGGYSRLTIRAEGKEHTVNLVNTHHDSFDAIEYKLANLLDEKVPDWTTLPA